jgi:[ribosomal protein S18]-alanine N-acetyltransferase
MAASGPEPGSASRVTIRRLMTSDVPAISAILQESPEATAWSEESLLRLALAGSAAWVAALHGAVAGCLIGRVAADEFEILNMAVSRKHRRSGIGSKLLETAMEFSRMAGCARAYLEVRVSNGPALALYTRHGFAECGRRVRYYRDPAEDAVLLSLSLSGTQ